MESVLGVPACGVKAAEGEHFLHVFKHVIKQPASERELLEAMPLSTRTVLARLEVIFKVLLRPSVLVLAKKTKVFE